MYEDLKELGKFTARGEEYRVLLTQYTDGNTALVAKVFDKDMGCEVVYGNLTINLPEQLAPGYIALSHDLPDEVRDEFIKAFAQEESVVPITYGYAKSVALTLK